MRKTLYFISICAFVLGSIFIYKGFDKKMNYQKPKRYSNSYVGGDAYNYIINSNYFTGYNVLGMGCYIITILGITSAEILSKMDENYEQSKQLYDFISQHPMLNNSGGKTDNYVKQKSEKFSVGDWGPLPNIPFTNNDDNANHTVNPTDSNSHPDQPIYDRGFSPNQTQSSQNYPNTSQQRSNTKWQQQNPFTNQSVNNYSYQQPYRNIPTSNPTEGYNSDQQNIR